MEVWYAEVLYPKFEVVEKEAEVGWLCYPEASQLAQSFSS